MVLFNHSWEDKWVHIFPKGICPKVNLIGRLEYELAYYGSAVQRFNHTPRGHTLNNLQISRLSKVIWFSGISIPDVYLIPNLVYVWYVNLKNTDKTDIWRSIKSDFALINPEKRTCPLINFLVPAGQRVKMKESEKIDKHLDLARELKELWNHRVSVVSIIVGALGKVPKG